MYGILRIDTQLHLKHSHNTLIIFICYPSTHLILLIFGGLCQTDTWYVGDTAVLTYNNTKNRMKIEFVYFILLSLNAFPVKKTGISAIYSLRELLVQ